MKGGQPRLPFLFMSEALYELQRLSMNGKATIVIEDGYARVSFKAPGRPAEVVNAHDSSSVESVVAELLKRLGYAGLHTTTEFIRLVKQRPAKLAALKSLLAQIRDIKRDVFITIEEVEPRLASPRSSLNPQFMEVERD